MIFSDILSFWGSFPIFSSNFNQSHSFLTFFQRFLDICPLPSVAWPSLSPQILIFCTNTYHNSTLFASFSTRSVTFYLNDGEGKTSSDTHFGYTDSWYSPSAIFSPLRDHFLIPLQKKRCNFLISTFSILQF